MNIDRYRRFRERVHERVCVPSRVCTCPQPVDDEALEIGRERALHVHTKFEHPGPPGACTSLHDVICKAVWP